MNILPIVLGAALAAVQPRALVQRQYPEAYLRDVQAVGGSLLVTGYTERKEQHDHVITNYHTPFVSLLDGQMNPLWTARFQESLLGEVKSVALQGDRVYAFGQHYEGKEGVAWLVILDDQGRVIHDLSYYKEGYHTTEGIRVMPQPDGSMLLLADIFLHYSSYGQPWLIKVDHAGSVIWDKVLASPYPMGLAFDVVATPDGGVVVAGSIYKDRASVGNQKGTAWMVKMGATGTVEWERLYELGSPMMVKDVVVDPEGTMIVCLGDEGGLLRDSHLWVMDAKGNKLRDFARFSGQEFEVSDIFLNQLDGTLWLAGQAGESLHIKVLDGRGQVSQSHELGASTATRASFNVRGELAWMGRHCAAM